MGFFGGTSSYAANENVDGQERVGAHRDTAHSLSSVPVSSIGTART